jgi:hypothetical protein
MKKVIMFLCHVTLFTSVFGQEVLIGNGYYEMILPKKYDKANIEKECTEKAQLVALEKTFGKTMSQNTSSSQQASMVSGQSSSIASFSSSSMSFVSGRWIKDLITPEIEYFKSKGKDWIAVTVKGEVQQLSKEEIAENPVTAYDFLSLAVAANEMGNARKALRYLESYIEKETIPFLEPHLLFIELMKDEEREEELKSIYAMKPDITFFKMLEIMASSNDNLNILRSLYKLHKGETNVTLQLVIGKMQCVAFMDPMVYQTDEGKTTTCQAMAFSDDFDDVLDTKYYKNNQYFISSNSMKNYLSQLDVGVIKGWGKSMYNGMKSRMQAISEDPRGLNLEKLKTKEDCRSSVYEFLKLMPTFDYSCNPEYRDKVFDQIWVELGMDSKF